MRFLFISSIAALSFFSSRVAAEELVPIENIFVGQQYSSANETTIGVAGYLPDSCHQLESIDYELFDRTITVTAHASVDASKACMYRIQPFFRTVQIGDLERGTYDIQSRFASAWFEVVTPREAAPLFHPTVLEAKLTDSGHTEASQLVLKGKFPRLLVGCMVLEEVETRYSHRGNTLRAIPKVAIKNQCPENYNYSFSARTTVDVYTSTPTMISVRQSSQDEHVEVVR